MTDKGRKRGAMAAAAAVGLIAGIAMVATLGAASPPAAGDRAALERVVHDYILEHPEIIPEAMNRLQERETAQRIGAERKAIETPFAGAWAGAADADVTLVMFTDYACGFCRASVADVDRLLAGDKRLKVVWREIPILGPASDAAARMALAGAEQGRYPDLHRRIFAGGPPTEAKLKAVAAASGINAVKAAAAARSPAIQAEIDANLALAQRLGVSGTPAFVVGDQFLSGAVGYEALAKAVADARARLRAG